MAETTRPATPDPGLTEGHLLGGRVRYAQPASGHRSGIEPVLLAACVPARPGETVLEGGTGAGAGLLCLAARVAGLRLVGIERDTMLAALARDNLASNGVADVELAATDIALAASHGPFDHAFANPPWYNPASTASPLPLRASARQAEAGIEALWVAPMAAALRPRGTLSLILPAASLASWMAALVARQCGEIAVLPLWKRPGEAAKLVILQAVRGGLGPCRMLPGLVLHQVGGGFTPAADAILRDGAWLEI